MAQDRDHRWAVVNTIMNLQFQQQKAENVLARRATINFLRRILPHGIKVTPRQLHAPI
jgi:hypothetical protein